MRLSEKYIPTTLDEIVGQHAPIRRLKELVANPYPCCFLLEGLPGVGKTATANALAEDMGCCPWTGKFTVKAPRLGIEKIEELFGHALRMRPMSGSRWHVLIIEELERCVSDAARTELKCQLSEGEMPEHLIVVATSNDISKLEPALLERFEKFSYSSGLAFAAECREWLTEVWAKECLQRGLGERDMPAGWMSWGVDRERFSLRMALNSMGSMLDLMEAVDEYKREHAEEDEV